MRVYVTLLVAVAAILASSGIVSAVTTTKVEQQTPFESINDAHTDNDDARLLRKRVADDSDDVSTEERGAIADALKTATAWFSPRQQGLKLLTKDVDDLVAKGVPPEKIKKIVAKAVSGGATDEEMKMLNAFAQKFEDQWFRNGNW